MLGGAAGLAALAVLGVVAPLALAGLVLGVLRRNRAVLAPGAMPAVPPPACPRCGTAMLPGRVLLGRGANWVPESAPPPGALATVFGALPNTISMALPPALNRAWCCADCAMLTVDHSALIALRRRPWLMPAVVVHGFLAIAGFSAAVALTGLATGPGAPTLPTLLAVAAAAFVAAVPVAALLIRRALR
jgi:hypothetical protein